MATVPNFAALDGNSEDVKLAIDARLSSTVMSHTSTHTFINITAMRRVFVTSGIYTKSGNLVL